MPLPLFFSCNTVFFLPRNITTMSTRASGSVLHAGLDSEEEDFDATFTDDEAALNSSDDDDDGDDDDEDMEDEEKDVEEEEELDDRTDLPTPDVEEAVTKRLAQLNAALGHISCKKNALNENSGEDVEMHIDVLCPFSDLSKDEKEYLKKAKTIRHYDPSKKGGCKKPISKKKQRATAATSTAGNVEKSSSGKRTLSTLVPSQKAQGKDPKAAYLPHQTDAIEKLTDLLTNGSGVLLAHAPGWGKTLSTLGILSAMQENNKTKAMTAIVLYPLTLASVWRMEFDKWDFPNLMFSNAFESKRQIDNFIEIYSPSADQPGVMRLFMMTHDLFVHAVNADMKAALNTVDFLVIDEVHVFKNDATKKHLAVINSRSDDFCGRTIGLTGTPVQNNVAELYGLLNLIQPNYFGSLTKKEVLSKAGATCKNSSLVQVMINNDWLYKRLTSIMHRQDASSVLHSLLTNDDYAICFDAGFAKDSSLQPSKPALQAREEMLQQSKDSRIELVNTGITGCIDQGAKLLVFSERKEFLDTLYKMFEDTSLLLTGDTSNSTRAKLVKEFQSNDSIKVFFLSIKAAGMGITLTKATHVFICDACWNPTYETQAIARAVRIGQTKTVKVYRFLAQSSIEIMIARDGPNKLGTADRIVDDKPLSSIFSQEQLREKNPQYIVDPCDKCYEVPNDDAVLTQLHLHAVTKFVPLNYAKLIHIATKEHTEKEAWAYDQHMLSTMHYKKLGTFCLMPDLLDESVQALMEASLWPPIVEIDATSIETYDLWKYLSLTCKFGPYKRDDKVKYKMQIAYGDDEKFINHNTSWGHCDIHEVIGKEGSYMKDRVWFEPFAPQGTPLVDDTKYMAIRLQACLTTEKGKKEVTSNWSDPSAVFKKSFFV
jgi:superfamily II DNA or RNA helicase